MKDYNRIANKIAKMGEFSDIHNCGYPTEHNPVNLYFLLCEAYVIGYGFYVSYDWGKWNIDYTLDPSIRIRTNMKHIRGIKTDREMYAKVEEIINMIREQCGTKNSNINKNTVSKWSQIQCNYFDENEEKYCVDAWKTRNGNEEGKVIAKINLADKSVEYIDEDAKTDEYAQCVIKEFLENGYVLTE